MDSFAENVVDYVCPGCYGSGELRVLVGGYIVIDDCHRCGGSGRIERDDAAEYVVQPVFAYDVHAS